MRRLPFPVRLSLTTAFCALIASGFVLAHAAFTRDSALIAIAAGLFLLVAGGATLLIGRQVKPWMRDQEPMNGDAPVFENMTLGQEEAFAGLPVPEEPAPPQDDQTLRRIQKAQALERLRDGIAHDLNNRLMVIGANVDAVARQVKDRPALRRKLLSALVAADQAGALIARSTAFARQQEARVQHVDLAERVSAIAALMSRSLLRDTVELRLMLENDLWPVEADPDDVDTAIVTLSAGVRDALTAGGTVTIEARNAPVQKGSLPDPTLEGDFVRLSIRSAGPGEKPREAQSLADQAPCETEPPPWLAMSRGLRFLQAIGGASEMRRHGEETTIVLYLPRARAAALLACGSRSDDGPGEDARGYTEILVVDDELEVALALQGMLEEFGYMAGIATNPAQAMKSLRSRRPGLVLADVTMPGATDGVMLARDVRRMFPDLPIVLITGNPVVGEECEFPLLQKPIVSRDLHAAIQRHLTPPDENKIVPLFPGASRSGR